MESFVASWLAYDWRVTEAEINSFANYRVQLDGMPIHFIHERGRGPAPIPVILTHGWPWTFWDWKDVIGPLADPLAHGGRAEDAFDVIVPSLPGFAFSSPLRSTGIGVRATAALWVKLMREVLGYERFSAAGAHLGGEFRVNPTTANNQDLPSAAMDASGIEISGGFMAAARNADGVFGPGIPTGALPSPRLQGALVSVRSAGPAWRPSPPW